MYQAQRQRLRFKIKFNAVEIGWELRFTEAWNFIQQNQLRVLCDANKSTFTSTRISRSPFFQHKATTVEKRRKVSKLSLVQSDGEAKYKLILGCMFLSLVH